VSFSNVPAVLARALDARDFSSLTPVQEAVLAEDAAERDLLVSAQTGSGKTVAYGLAMAPVILDGEKLPYAEAPLALIIAPTRELALQVQAELTWLYASAGARIVACVGGMDPIKERRQLERGVHIVVGTPGRLRDHMERGALELGELKAVVLDEADEMLDLGFQEDMQFILDATSPERRTFLFSATLPKPIIALARNYQNDALRIEIGDKKSGHADIEYRAVRIAHPKIDRAVVNLLRAYDPACALVFCATRLAVQKMGEVLAQRGFNVVSLSGEMGQAERNRALQALRDGRAKVCVATDVAARGIDVPHLSLVIHAELPKDAEIMQHRSGRTGRAGKKGICVLLVPPSRRRKAEQMLLQAGVQYSWEDVPSRETIEVNDRERILQSPLLTEPGETEDSIIAAALTEKYEPHQIAAAFAKLYRAGLPEAEDVDEYVENPKFTNRDDRDNFRERRREERHRDEKRERSERRERAPRERGERSGEIHTKLAERHGLSDGSVWFRISVGRERNADPKWLLPEICRQGEVTKKDIGQIRIFDRETRFELDAKLAPEFTAKVTTRQKGGVVIAPANGGEPEFLPPSEEKQTERHARKDKPRSQGTPRHRAEAGDRAADDSGKSERKFHKREGKPRWEGGEQKPLGKKGQKSWAPKTDGQTGESRGFVPRAKPKHPKADKAVRFSDHLADEERRAKRKERKKEKRKLKALTQK